MKQESLVYGTLNEDTFKDFTERLQHHVRGAGVKDHCTCDATFVVQSKHLVSGIDKDYTDQTMLWDEDCKYFSKEDYLENTDDEWVDEQVENGLDINASDYEFFSYMEDNFDHCTHTGYDWEWKYVNHHMTREAAEAFIKRKRHDYGTMRVYVESAYFSWELKAIIDGILDGKIGYLGES